MLQLIPSDSEALLFAVISGRLSSPRGSHQPEHKWPQGTDEDGFSGQIRGYY